MTGPIDEFSPRRSPLPRIVCLFVFRKQCTTEGQHDEISVDCLHRAVVCSRRGCGTGQVSWRNCQTANLKLAVRMIVHLSTFNRFDYRIGVPGGRAAYEPWVNRRVAGNGVVVFADRQAMHGLGYSAAFVLSANSILVFAR